MYYTYILQSRKDGDLYIGYTNDLRRRVAEHNNGKSFATGPRRPLDLIYYEAYKAATDARKRESSLKLRGRARVQLMKRLSASLSQA